ncbi:hypothetical protein B0T24DRAFT_109839 [Lasiosphaeria ovina]|uniref:CCHC-type domain-containing protein n=1 Tax=Lasiosphaeria ovina TaxID=92902 RepID=A0AAE0JTY8_9PEZI|nr:hypothetical protein B0T24DRAFT_109839 [Lasiosphaeria ovina]
MLISPRPERARPGAVEGIPQLPVAERDKPPPRPIAWIEFKLPKASFLVGRANYGPWARIVRLFMRASGWTPDAVLSEMQEMHLAINLFSIIGGSEPLGVIRTHDRGTAVLAELKGMYQPSDQLAYNTAVREMGRLRLTKRADVFAYTLRFNELHAQMAATAPGAYDSDRLTHLYIRGAADALPMLAEAHDNRLALLAANPDAVKDGTLQPLHIPDIQSLLLRASTWLEDDDEDDSNRDSVRRRKDGSVIRRGKCGRCKKRGHWAQECRSDAAKPQGRRV